MLKIRLVEKQCIAENTKESFFVLYSDLSQSSFGVPNSLKLWLKFHHMLQVSAEIFPEIFPGKPLAFFLFAPRYPFSWRWVSQQKENDMSQYDPEFIGPVRAPEYLPLEFQIMFIRSVLKNWMQPEEEHFANKFDRNQGWISVLKRSCYRRQFMKYS